MLVNNPADIMKNIHTLEKYRKSGNPRELQFYKKIIGRGRVFVVVKINGRYSFAPSKFVGYSENNIEHISKLGIRDGRKTNRKIDKILGRHEINDIIESEFIKFCKQNSIKLAANPRTYWKSQYYEEVMIDSEPEVIED